MQTIDEITRYLKDNLTEKRFAHTIRVAQTAQSLAKIWGADNASSFLAGLVHDCAKELPQSVALRKMEESGYNFDGTEKDFPALLHAPCGAVLARELFGITDEDILNAVRYHTVGRANMSLLEKIVFVADFIEPGRKFKEAKEVSEIAQKDLDRAVLLEADTVIRFNLEKGKRVHPDTVITRNYYLKSVKEGTENEA